MYVDAVRRPGYARRGRAVQRSRMFGDTPGEVETLARKIGLPVSAVENPGTPFALCWVTEAARLSAIRLGAVPVSNEQANAMLGSRIQARAMAERS